MITIDEKLYVTKEINNIIEKYAREIVLRKFLTVFSFENSDSDEKVISQLLSQANSCNGDIDPHNHINLSGYVSKFLTECSKEDLTALYFWEFNLNYLNYLDEAQNEEPESNEDDSLEEADFKFGRVLAYKLYDPESSGLHDKLHERLQNLCLSYSSEFDLSLVDEHTVDEINEAIDHYCSILLMDY